MFTKKKEPELPKLAAQPDKTESITAQFLTQDKEKIRQFIVAELQYGYQGIIPPTSTLEAQGGTTEHLSMELLLGIFGELRLIRMILEEQALNKK